MIELIVTPDHDHIELAIPESYIGKKVKLSYTIEETEEDAPVIIRKKPSDFKGILRADIVDEFQDYIKKIKRRVATTYLIDSNVFIDYAGKKFSGLAEERLDSIFNAEFHYSVISRMEILHFKNAYDDELNNLTIFLSYGNQHDVDLSVSDQVLKLKRSITKKNLPDLIIAATAIINDYILLTRNISDFKNIPELKFDSPWDWK